MPGYSFEVGKVRVAVETTGPEPDASAVFAEIVAAMAELYEDDDSPSLEAKE
jgi:hypothetical protein